MKTQEICPVCGQSHDYLLHHFHPDLDKPLLEKLAEEAPNWQPDQGACTRCLDQAHLELQLEFFRGTGEPNEVNSYKILPTPLRLFANENLTGKGDPNIVKLYNGAFYSFASEEHKQMFGADPMKYMPQYGGYCAYALNKNKLRPIDPQFFQFVDGRLMLQHSKSALDLFSENIPENTKKADENWPGLVAKKAGK